MPYIRPKFTALALRLSSGVTSSMVFPKISAAVWRWMSAPERNAFLSPSSPESSAMRRSSICE